MLLVLLVPLLARMILEQKRLNIVFQGSNKKQKWITQSLIQANVRIPANGLILDEATFLQIKGLDPRVIIISQCLREPYLV
ncbi:hypothetical protein O6H91_05G109600 [Diphasiastrum complanatum]|uniref:Uncharacterized protein n=1 Tax=Diphasiastrum complanatum TaxID=34168 RepID=A0ACC2DS26_DIPCM|nr:hypothetical protein O6H91_05G109600 [Diphasiastrum complanatum]